MNISIQLKRDKSLTLPLPLFVSGLKKIKYVLLELHPDNECTIKKTFITLLASIVLLQKGKKSCIVVSRPKSKWMTLNDKKIFSNPNTLIISWLQTLALELIGKEKALKPFWNKQCEELSKKLWLPIKTDYVDSDLNSSNSFSPLIKQNSWFLTETIMNPQIQNSQKTSSPLSMFTPVETWEEEGIRAKKIRIYPNATQMKLLKQWINTTRYVYNKSLQALKTEKDIKYNFMSLRNRFVTYKIKGEINKEIKEWELETPKDVRAESIRDLIKAYNVCITNLKRGNINKFKLSYRKKKTYPSIVIPKTAVSIENNTLYIYKTYIKNDIKISKDRCIEDLKIEYDCRVQYKNNNWYLIVPIKVKVKEKNENKKGIVALDPGVKTFQTSYSETDSVKIQHDTELIKKLNKKIDMFRSLRDKKMIKKKSYTRRSMKVYRRINNLIDELHFQTINYLTKHHNWILLPSFESQEMAMKGTNKRCNRDMMQLKHYMFKERLKSKCMLDKGTEIDIVTEEYTSKTCGLCGWLNRLLRNDRIFKCKECDVKIDRDINGARNILIKYIVWLIMNKK